MTVWAGVDVGGPRKGFHVALVDDVGLTEAIANPRSVGEAVALLEHARPQLVAVDCPRRPAAAGERSRPDERALAGAVCGIRFTPDEATIYGERPPGDDFYGGIKNGFALYAALAAAGLAAVECFPTAWTRWGGARAETSPFGDIVVPVAAFAHFPRSGRASRADLP